MTTFLGDVFWIAIGALGTFLCALVAHRIGFIQITHMKQTGVLDKLRTKPKIGVRTKIDGRKPNGPHYPTSYHLMIEIYNEGELAVANLKGQCSVYSPIQEISKCNIPIYADFLGRDRPLHFEGLLYGTTLEGAMRGQNAINFNADIEFTYETGIPEDELQQYKANYNFNGDARNLIKIE